MAAKKKNVSIDKLFDPNNTDFSMVQVLNEEGEVVNPDLLPDVSMSNWWS